MERQAGKFSFGSRDTPSLFRPRGLLHAETTQKLPFFFFACAVHANERLLNNEVLIPLKICSHTHAARAQLSQVFV